MKPIMPALLVLAAASCALSLASCGKPDAAAPDAAAPAPAPAPDAKAPAPPLATGPKRDFPPVAEVGKLTFPTVERATLKNGIPVMLARRTAIPKLSMRLEFDAGPAVRYTSFYDGAPDEQRLAGRGGLNMKWTPLPRLTLAQELAVYVEKENTTAASTTSVETLLFGPLKGRLSYAVQYERDAPPDQKRTDTVSRASLVYSF